MATQRNLILRAASGDRAAQAALVVELQPFLQRIVRRICWPDPIVADDAINEASISLLKGFGTFRLASQRRVREQLRAWAACVVKNACWRVLRIEKRQKTVALVAGYEPGQEGAEVSEALCVAVRDAAFGAASLQGRVAWSAGNRVSAKELGQLLGMTASGARHHKSVTAAIFRIVARRVFP